MCLIGETVVRQLDDQAGTVCKSDEQDLAEILFAVAGVFCSDRLYRLPVTHGTIGKNSIPPAVLTPT